MNCLQIDTTITVPQKTDTQLHVFHRPATPYQAIRLLPRDASEAEKDSIVQHFFQPIILAPSTCPDTLNLPGLKGYKTDWKEVPSYREGFFTGNAFLHPELRVTFTGIPGDPVPYRLQSDVFITSTLLISFFVAIFIIARSLHTLLLQLKIFFYNRDRKDLFLLKSDSEMKSQSYVILLACFLLSILFFNYTEIRIPSVFNRISPYKLLFLDMSIFLIYYIIKYIAYSICNWTFFSQQQRTQWTNAYNLIGLGKALLFFPLALLVVYFDLSIQVTIWIVILILLISQILVIFKAKQIFFYHKFGLFHLILYFCTLEMIPLFILWRLLIKANEFMIVYI